MVGLKQRDLVVAKSLLEIGWLGKGLLKRYVCAQSLQSCLTLCNPMDYSLPGSSVHGISKARLLEWVAISFSRGSSWVSCIAGRFFTICATGESKLFYSKGNHKQNKNNP